MLIERRPGAVVGEHVLRYCGYAECTGVRTRQREPLSSSAVIIFGMDSTIHVDGQALGTFAGGLGDSCPVVEHDGEMRGVQVDVTPLGAHMLLGVPMHELARRSVPLAEVIGTRADELDEQLVEAGSWEDRFALLELELARRLAAATPPPPDVVWAWNRLRATDGRVRIAELASALGCSRKHLAARFREHVGLPPKLAARVIRFRRAAELLTAGASLDELACACGYYDQSHLDRDFRELAGTTPTAYRADPRSVTFFQDTGAAAA